MNAADYTWSMKKKAWRPKKIAYQWSQLAEKKQERQERQKNAKQIVRGIGGATTGAVVAGSAAVGISASVVAGVFTFGVGTVIGLVATVE